MGIYTLTMNPAIDMFIKTSQLKNNIVNRTLYDELQPNGKGVNVSFILKMLDIPNTALGFSAGFTGQYIKDELLAKGITEEFIDVDGITRINVFTQVLETSEEYKLVNKGPEISPSAQDALLEKIRLLGSNDYLVISGSFPRGIDSSYLVKIAEITNEKNVSLILDISDPVILTCLKYKPYLIKPNDEEIAQWFGVHDISEDEILVYGKSLQNLGARNVLISLGGKGAVMLTDSGEVFTCNAPKGEVVNTACAGDTTLGTFLGSKILGLSTEESLIKAVAAGSSTAFRSGLTDFSDVDELSKQILLKNGGKVDDYL
ncbi:1-phosphofructokinase [Streptococcus suis]